MSEKSIESMTLPELRGEVHDLRKARDAAGATAQPDGSTVSAHRIAFNEWLLTVGLDTASFETFSYEGKSTIRAQYAEHMEKKKRAAHVQKVMPTVKAPPGSEKWTPAQKIRYANLVSHQADSAEFIKHGFEPPARG